MRYPSSPLKPDPFPPLRAEYASLTADHRYADLPRIPAPAGAWVVGRAEAIGTTEIPRARRCLNFLSAALGLQGLTLGKAAHMSAFLAGHSRLLEAISAGAAFFAACSPSGNGPNFMVKSIAEHCGVRCPTFTGYIAAYTIPVLLPVFAPVWVLFFR